MRPYDLPSIVRLQIPAPGGEPRRTHPKQPHPASVVAAVRHLVETTRLPYKIIAERTNVNAGTVSRWVAKHGWQRPPGAWPRAPRPDARYVPNVIGRALATRLRAQAERLLADIESADTVDPAALAEAIGLLERARAEQRVRRGQRLVPPPAPRAPRPKPEPDAAARARIRETRRKAAHKGWGTRWANQKTHPAWMGIGGTRPKKSRVNPYSRERDDLPSPHLPHLTKPDFEPVKWDRRAAALQGWKRRYARMRETGRKDKKET
jgi:hypothetical protein